MSHVALSCGATRTQFGYLAYLRETDPVDPGVAEFLGGGCQSVFVSHKHQATIVSMGDFGLNCEPIWANMRMAIVSSSHEEEQPQLQPDRQLKNRTAAVPSHWAADREYDRVLSHARAGDAPR